MSLDHKPIDTLPVTMETVRSPVVKKPPILETPNLSPIRDHSVANSTLQRQLLQEEEEERKFSCHLLMNVSMVTMFIVLLMDESDVKGFSPVAKKSPSRALFLDPSSSPSRYQSLKVKTL